MDIVDTQTRSRMMASVRQKNTGPEVKLRKAVHRLGLRYRLHEKRLPGSPDLVFPRFRAIVFVHGCFWHAHGCKYSKLPRSHQEYWREKLAANRDRDARKTERLIAMGWRVLVVWSCVLEGSKPDKTEHVVKQVHEWLHGDNRMAEIPTIDH